MALRTAALLFGALAVSAQCPGKSGGNGKLNVHFSPHTHDDVGWDETYMQYFEGNGPIGGRNVSMIITQVVQALQANPKRKFTYVEQAFFQVWYENQSPAIQATVQGLVASGQLTFVNGGWSMHDEANPTYIDMLDNTAIGQRNILNNFGASALPTVTWQIDPFGHSAFQGVMSSSLAGYKGLIWGREAADFKQLSCANKSVERIWKPSVSLGAAAATAQFVFVDAGYQSPYEVHRCDYPNRESDCAAHYAAGDLASLISDIDSYREPNVRGNDILLNFGDDFTWENAADYFPYLDALIDALNADPSGRFTAFYSNPAIYMKAKLDSVASFPQVVGDFFPYNDDTQGHNMWAGYFTSRPALKGFIRESSSYMQTARQLQVLTGGVPDLGPENPLFKLERAMGVAQHHDAVAGTEQQNVAYDYALQLEAGRFNAYASLGATFAKATGYSADYFTVCPLNNVTLCPALEAGQPTVVLAYNSLGQAAANATIRLSAGFPAGVASYSVYDSTGKPVTAQLIPLSARDTALRTLYNSSNTVSTQWLAFVAPLPAAGFSAFFLVPQASASNAPFTFPSTVAPLSGQSAQVSNGRLSLTVSAATGFLSGYADAVTGVNINLAQSWASYIGAAGNNFNGSSQSSGAYIFRPDGQTPNPLQASPADVVVVTGPVVNEFQSTYAYVTQSTRVWAGASTAEVEWTVGPVDISDKNSHEVITRYDGNFDSNGDWTTDSNCRESQLRRLNWRANWDINPSEPVSANYFPVNCLIKTTSTDGVSLAVAVDRSEGSSSLTNGQLEIMVHRRMTHDDGRGVGEALNEPGLDGKGLIIRGRHWISAAPAASAAPVYKALQQQGLALPTAVTAFASLGALTPAQWIAQNTASASLLTAPLPANVHLATAHAQGPNTVLLRLAHLYEVNEDPVLSQNVTVNLGNLFAGRTVTAAVEMTLPGTQPLANVPTQTYVTDGGASYTVPMLPTPPSGAALAINIGPMEIRTFMLTLA